MFHINIHVLLKSVTIYTSIYINKGGFAFLEILYFLTWVLRGLYSSLEEVYGHLYAFVDILPKQYFFIHFQGPSQTHLIKVE